MENKYIQLPLPAEQVPPRTQVSANQIKGLKKLADVIIPDKIVNPTFNDTKPENQINGMLDYMYQDDRQAILIILSIFAFTPKFKIRWLMLLIESAAKWPGYAGSLFRMLQIALKGLVFTLYYSDFTPDKKIFKQVQYDAHIHP